MQDSDKIRKSFMFHPFYIHGSIKYGPPERAKCAGKNFPPRTSCTLPRIDWQHSMLLHFAIRGQYFDMYTWVSSQFFEVHLMNLIEMYNIIMTSFNKIKFNYLIQVWQDVMKIMRNVKNVNVEKILWWRHHLSIPPPPYVTISNHFRVTPSPLPRWRPFWTNPYW